MKRLWGIWVLLLCVAVSAQEPAPQSDDQVALAEARQRLESLGEPATDDAKKSADAVRRRIQVLEELIRTASNLGALSELQTHEQRRAAVERELDTLRAAEAPSSVTLAAADELNSYDQIATAARAAQVKARSELQDAKSRGERWRSELASLPERRNQVRVALEQLSEGDDHTKYQAATERLTSRLIDERNEYLTRTLENLNSLRPTFELELRIATFRADRAVTLLELAREQAEALRETEVRSARGQAEDEARRAELEHDPLERFRLQVRSEVARLLAETTAHETDLVEIKRAMSEEREALEHLRSERRVLENRLRLRPAGAAILLQRSLRRARRVNEILDKVELPRVYDARDENQEQMATVIDMAWDLRLPEDENPFLRELLDETEPVRHDEAREAFDRIIDEEGLSDALATRLDGLEAFDVAIGELSNLIAERDAALDDMLELIRGRLIWNRSDPPVGVSTFVGAFEELTRIGEPYRESGTWSGLMSRLGARFPLVILIIGLVVGLGYVRRRVDRWKREEDAPTQVTPMRRSTVHTWVWVCVLPLQLWVVAEMLRHLGASDAFNPPVASFVEWQALFILIRRVSVALFDNGILVRGSKLTPAVGMQIVSNVRLATLASQVLYATHDVFANEPFDFDFLPRLLEPMWYACIGVSILLLFRWSGPLVLSWTRPRTLTRLLVRGFWIFNAATLIPLLILDGVGYRFFALTGLRNAFRIYIGLFLLAALFHAMERMGGWLTQKVANQSPGQQSRAKAELQQNAGRVLTRVSATVVIILAIVLLQRTWGIGEPLFRVLSETRLGDLEAGNALTAWDIFLAIVWVLIGHVIARNLVKIHEAIVVPLAGAGEVGGRYAALTLARYAVLFVAYSAAMLNVGFSFQTLGWFMTAASVGIGFGLQTIIANFISGLILLFERPIRVGDIVTIGSTSGVVDKIMMRATVVTNWERQTLIIPNSKFIAENLTNWTRNDRIMRRTIDLRVAYGSDVERILRLLDEIVVGHPSVLTDPPHRIWFQAFGEFGIEFQVWFFATIEDGLRTRSEIHALINERFAQEGIEIPVVQRDLRAKSSED